ncbi:MAG: hypothetical protein R3B93_06320 [Bacteroidia bacterium]
MDNQTSKYQLECGNFKHKVLNRESGRSDLEILAAFVKDLDVAKELLMTFRSLERWPLPMKNSWK